MDQEVSFVINSIFSDPEDEDISIKSFAKVSDEYIDLYLDKQLWVVYNEKT